MTSSRRKVLGIGDSEMQGVSVAELRLSLDHTNVCAKALKKLVTVQLSDFKIGDFLEALKLSSAQTRGQHSGTATVAKLLAREYYSSFVTPNPNMLLGAIKAQDLTVQATQNGSEEPSSSVQATAKVPRKKRRAVASQDGEAATQTEILNDGSATANDVYDNVTEDVAKGVLRKLRSSYKEDGEAPKLLEVAHGNTPPEVLGHLMAISFLSNDGHVKLGIKEGTEVYRGPSDVVNLTLKPVKKKKEKKAEGSRKPAIVSISGAFLREWIQSGGQFPPAAPPSDSDAGDEDLSITIM